MQYTTIEKDQDYEWRFVEMKRLVVFAILMLVVSASATLADGNWGFSSGSAVLTEHGWGYGIPISFGTEKKTITGKIVFVDCYGLPLAPSEDGILPIWQSAGLITAYVIPDDVVRVNQYEVRWALSVLADWDQMNVAEFDSAVGWRFYIRPEDYSGKGRTLSLAIKEFDAKHWYARAVFKITYAHGSVVRYDKLFLTVVKDKPAQSRPVENADGLKTMVAEINARFGKDESYVTELEKRVTALESKPCPTEPTVAPTTDVVFDLNVVTSCPSNVRIEVNGKSYHGNSLRLCLTPGTYQAQVFINDRTTNPVSFYVKPGMGKVNVTVQ